MGASSLARRRYSMNGSCSIAMVICFLSVLIGILKETAWCVLSSFWEEISHCCLDFICAEISA